MILLRRSTPAPYSIEVARHTFPAASSRGYFAGIGFVVGRRSRRLSESSAGLEEQRLRVIHDSCHAFFFSELRDHSLHLLEALPRMSWRSARNPAAESSKPLQVQLFASALRLHFGDGLLIQFAAVIACSID